MCAASTVYHFFHKADWNVQNRLVLIRFEDLPPSLKAKTANKERRKKKQVGEKKAEKKNCGQIF